MSNEGSAAIARVHEIASMLGIPVEEMMSHSMPESLWANNECLRLWFSLKTDAGRDDALDALRRILDEERD